jgi:hypothetical protein
LTGNHASHVELSTEKWTLITFTEEEVVLCRVDAKGYAGPCKFLFRYHTDYAMASETVQIYISRLFQKPSRLNSNAACNRGKPLSMVVNAKPGKLGFSQDIYISI